MATKNKLFVYGTLRPGNSPTVEIPGYMHDLGWFPGVRLGEDGCNSHFLAEIIEVDDEKLAQLDRYEGYRPSDPAGSLYLRVPYKDGEIYVYNSPMDSYQYIEGGDWMDYTGRKELVS